MRGDVDGDGRPDLVYFTFTGYRLFLGVCTASGRRDRITSGGMGEVLKLIDVEPDGRDEIVYGGTTVNAEIDDVAVFTHGALHRVRLPTGREFLLVRGFDPGIFVRGRRRAGDAYGCQDSNHNGRGELVQVVVRRQGAALTWVKRAYTINGSVARLTTRSAGHLRRRGLVVLAAASRLTVACTVKAPKGG